MRTPASSVFLARLYKLVMQKCLYKFSLYHNNDFMSCQQGIVSVLWPMNVTNNNMFKIIHNYALLSNSDQP